MSCFHEWEAKVLGAGVGCTYNFGWTALALVGQVGGIGDWHLH